MYPGSDRVRAAEELLRQDGDGRADIVLAGAKELWSAMFDMPDWPTPLKTKAIELQVSLFRHGKITDTIRKLSAPERLQLREEMLAFCDFAQRSAAQAS